MPELIVIEGIKISQDEEGRYSLTDLWKASGMEKKNQPYVWINLESTKRAIEFLSTQESRVLNPINIISGKGKKQGTYVCKELVYDYAAWLSPEFKFKVYTVFDDYIKDKLKEKDWRKLRHESASSYKVMQSVLQLQRQLSNKETQKHHYSNEARLINWALTGEFQSLDRDQLSIGDLNLLAKLEERNSVMLGISLNYEERKTALRRFVDDLKTQLAA